MISGRQVMNSIDQALNTARGNTYSTEQQIEEISRKQRDLQKKRIEDYRELARIRLGRLAEQGVVQHLDEVEREVITLLEHRQQALNGLLRQIQDGEEDLRQIEGERPQQLGQLEDAASIVDAAEAETQKRLNKEPHYKQQWDKTQQAERQAQHAAEKAARSDQERLAKGQSYEQDALFTYLWDRHYSLPEYRAFPLLRWLDGKVARLIGYADARANYSRLIEIPRLLHEHADSLKEAAEKEFEALKSLDTEARETDGIPALEKDLAAEQAALDAIDKRIDQAQSELQVLLDRKAGYLTGDDEYSSKAIDYLATEYQRDDLMELRREAQGTPFPDDDIIVSRLIAHETDQREQEASLQGLREMIKHNQKQLNEIEGLQADFKRNQFDRPGSVFGDQTMIAMMLGQFINGMMDRNNLWRVLQEQQRYRPRRSNPRFGSGGFGRGSVWNGGLGDIGDILGRGGGGGGWGGGGRGGGSGGGGFGTGGGF